MGGHSTLSLLIIHYNEVLENLERKSNCNVIYLNFSKAYDKVDHHILLQKVKNVGICGNLGKWIGTFLHNRTQAVKVGGCVSESINIVSRVPQDSVLGPILFFLCVANIGCKFSVLKTLSRFLLKTEEHAKEAQILKI